MSLIVPELKFDKERTEFKEMLSIKEVDGHVTVKINYSSLSVITKCLKLAQYQLRDQYHSKTEGDALTFGTAVHKALEYWYSQPIADRKYDIKEKEKAEIISYGNDLDKEAESVNLEAIRQFTIAGWPLAAIRDNKRSLQNGAKILMDYFRSYQKDGMLTVSDKDGPMIERRLEHVLHEEPGLTIIYHGTMDAVWQHENTGEVFVVDHKTASTLGGTYRLRTKPNHQYSGYLWLAQNCLDMDVKDFIVNGILVAKTKQECERHRTNRTQEDLEEFKEAVILGTKIYLEALANDSFPMTAPDPCTMWGGCSFHKVCDSPMNLRQMILDSEWIKPGAEQ